jgi:hypothetical protein
MQGQIASAWSMTSQQRHSIGRGAPLMRAVGLKE